MAKRKMEAWLTSAVEDGTVVSAMVLAESLRKTKTTRTIGVITSTSVSAEKRAALHKIFDAVFCIDGTFATSPKSGHVQEIQAMVYAFSLRFFNKCVFLSPNSFVLENVDELFEDKAAFKGIKNNGSMDLSIFMFSPNRDLWEHLWESVSHNGNILSEAFLSSWFSNQNGSVRMGSIARDIFAKFSLKTGTLLTDKVHTPIIQFVDIQNQEHFAAQLESVANLNVGLSEKLITATWLETYKENVLSVLKNPLTAPKLPPLDNHHHYVNEPIAVIGMSCRYPGANTLDEFWNMLYKGEEGVREPPAFRWTKEHSLRVSQHERKTNAGFLSTTVDEFDAKFFGVSPKEAAYMDPQARLLHEVVWESLEDSGIDPLSLYGTYTGIFTGSWMNDYKDIVQGSAERDFFRTYMGNSIGAAAARLSFLLGLTGPSIATESGCSSAIVALDLAVKSLRSGETNLSLAGGVNLLLHPFTSNIMDYVIAQNGRCKTFDSKADGFGRAEGCGVVVLKRLSDALRDRDNIWAVIRGSAVAQEGLSRSLGTPTVHCEALAMQLALKDANVCPDLVSFVETHGTGTIVGDPMEVAAIAKAYYSPTRKNPLIIGSVKTNVGHTESCSGITGLMKTILALQHELIPKHRNLESLNPEIFLESIPAVIPEETVPWPRLKGHPRIAGVSSFGITGTDGHLIIEEAPDYELPKFSLKLERPTHIMKICGKTTEALEELLQEYQNVFSERASKNNEAFANAAYTANIGRASFNHRAVIVANSYKEAVKAIQERQFILGELKEGETRQICFLFTGQGSQYQGMAKTLYDTNPIFRTNFDACDRTLRELYNLSIRQVLWESTPSSKELSRTIYSQTSIFCVEYCLLKLWQSWGIIPDYVLGHSLGEFAAAVAAGILDFKDALKLVAERSRLIDNLPRGSMLVIKASKSEVDKLMKSANIELDFAAANSSEQTVVAGDTQKIQGFLDFLKGKGVKGIILEATHAFHSRHMDPMLKKYREVAKTIKYNEAIGNIQYVSGMEGRIVHDASEINADYWVRHTREKVNFVDACAALRETEVKEYLEIGPQPILSSFVMMNNEEGTNQITCLPSLRRGMDDWQTILTTLGKLYLNGYKVDWKKFDDPYHRNKVSLPFNPFHRKAFWVENNSGHISSIHPLIGHNLNNASTLSIFQNDLSLKSVPYLKDHCIGNRIVFPGAGYTEMCLSAGYCVANGLTEEFELPRRPMRIENVRIDAPLELKEEKGCRLQVIVDLPEYPTEPTSTQADTEQTQGFRVKVFHQNTSTEESGKWVLHASSTFIPVASTKDAMKKWNPERIREILETVTPSSPDRFYKKVDDAGLKFGESFRRMIRAWKGEEDKLAEVVTEIRVPEDYGKYLLHPLIIDALFQTGILTEAKEEESAKLRVPIRIGQLTILKALEIPKEVEMNDAVVYLHIWPENEMYSGFVVTKDLTPVAYIEDIEIIDTNVRTIESILEQQCSSVPDAWEEVWRMIPGPFTNVTELAPLEPILSDDNLQKELTTLSSTSPEHVDIARKTNRLLYLYVLNGLYDLGWKPTLNECLEVDTFCEELQIRPQFRQLINFYFTIFQDEQGFMCYDRSKNKWSIKSIPLSHSQVKYEIDNLSKQLKQTPAFTVVCTYEHLANSLPKIWKGEESALSVLFPTDEDKQQFSADNYYQNYPGRPDIISSLRLNLKMIIKRQLSLNESEPGRVFRILEVGSGTGSITQHVLEWLRESWGDKFEYYFTDISQSFFTKAEKKFEEYSQNIKYALFNLEHCPIEQGIPPNYFDLVVASDVLHATRRLQETLVHIRQTMRPRATLCFQETITAARDITYVFGLLDSYWRFEDLHLRQHHTCCDENVWTLALEKSGYHSVHYSKVHVDAFGIISAEASEQIDITSLVANPLGTALAPKKEDKKAWVIFGIAEDTAMHRVANMLCTCGYNVITVFKSTDDPVTINKARHFLHDEVTFKTIAVEKEDSTDLEALFKKNSLHCIIYAWGMDIKIINQQEVALTFMQIVKWVLAQKRAPLLYVFTQGVHCVNESVTCNPTSATLFGMTKSLKNENAEIFVRYVDLANGSQDPRKTADQILFELTMCKGHKEGGRVQVAYRDNLRYEPKFMKTSIPTKHDELQLPRSSDRYHLILPETRSIQDLKFDTADVKEVCENQVEVKVKAYALNFRDIFAILKPIKQFETISAVGLDFAGVIIKLGKGPMTENFKVGDKVFGANFQDEQLASHLVLNADSVLRIPEKMTFWEASTLPAVFSTSYHCLISVAKMKKGDTVLIHTASGGVGLAAIQLAKHVGATIITTAGNPRKRAYLKSLGIEHVFHSRNTSYEQDIMRVTNGRGVDIVLNSITGPGFKEATLATCAKNARFVEMSKLTIWSCEEVKALRPDVEYRIVDLTTLENDKWAQLLASMTEYLNCGYLQPIPFVKFDALNIRQALQYFQKAKHVGKVVCVMPEVITQDGQMRENVSLFNDDSTYLITGGLGGIGFEVCKWMLEKGATDIVLIGRSSPTPDTADAIQSLRNKKGFNIVIKQGDVSDFEQCEAIIEEIGREGKPLRGVMHCAGVLRDNLYVNQNWESFDATFKPKVKGTWNLHNLTKHMQLEHFIFYSSITAVIGTPSQPNHAAANCFEDAFAHYRHSLGLPATTINWGQWAQVGCAKEIAITGVIPVSVKRMLNGLEVAMKTQKLQICLGEFESFSNLAILCPITKHYLDDRLWKQLGSTGQDNQTLKPEKFWSEMDASETKKDKLDVVQNYLKVILRTALRLEADEPINEDANIQDLGVDSLMLIELKNSIQTLLGSRVMVTAGLFKNCNTVRQLAHALVGKIFEECEGDIPLEPLTDEELTELLYKDCLLDESIQNTDSTNVIVKPSEIKTILITGATGQLGGYILAEITNCYKSIEKIICLVREVEGITLHNRIVDGLSTANLKDKVDMTRLELIPGDVAKPNFGLDQELYDKLSKSVEAVIHCAGKTDISEEYRNYESGRLTDVRSINVGGTINILKFASSKRTKLIYHTSTFLCGVLGESEDGTLSDAWPEMQTLKTCIEAKIPGVQLSRLVFELLLKEANQRGIPCKVFRFPWISGNSQSGHLNYLNNLYILRYLSFLKVNAIPSLSVPANFLPIDICASLSLKLFFNDESPFEIFNLGHPNPPVEQEFLHVAKKDFGKDLDIMEWKDFADRIQEDDLQLESLKNLYKDQRSMSMHMAEATGFVKGYLVSPDTFFTNKKVAKYLPNFGDNILPSMEIVSRDLHYLKSIGLFDKFGIL